MKRFAEARGLSPCRYDDRLWTAAAERKLALAGQPRPRALVLVAPTFSDIHVLAFGPAGLDRYTFPRQTAFGPEFTENDQVKPMPVGAVSLSPDSYERVIAAVSRNSEYAVSSSESGHDGVVYYFQNDADRCAFAWSPSKGTIGGHLAGLVDVLAEEHPSAESVEQTLSALENLELAH